MEGINRDEIKRRLASAQRIARDIARARRLTCADELKDELLEVLTRWGGADRIYLAAVREFIIPEAVWEATIFTGPLPMVMHDAHIEDYRRIQRFLRSVVIEDEAFNMVGAVDPSSPSKWRGHIETTMKIHHPKVMR